MRSLGPWWRISLAVTLLVILAFVEYDLFHRPVVYILTQCLVLVGVFLGPRYLERRRRQHRQQSAAQQQPEGKKRDASGPTTRNRPPAAGATRPRPSATPG
jgi:hypothetical protein